MGERDALMEVLRWGFIQMPAALYYYAADLELDAEDLGLLGLVFFGYTNRSKPLLHKGIEIRQITQCYPSLSKNKLAWRISKWARIGLVEIDESTLGREFPARRIFLDPLWQKLEELVARDHPELYTRDYGSEMARLQQELEQSNRKIQELESLLEEEKSKQLPASYAGQGNGFKKVADFIAQKTGNLVSPEMHREISRWLNEFKCKPEYLIIMLELCFERNIYDPREITAIARGLHEYAVGNLSGMEQYFRSVVDKPGHFPSRKHEFALEMMEFGSYTGIDMQAEARRKTYEKWRYEWRFSHEMIMKAGEIMCQRTKSGGMEYVERVLANWLAKGISTVAEAEQDTSEFKKRSQRAGSRLNILNRSSGDKAGMEIFVAPHVLEDLKTKA